VNLTSYAELAVRLVNTDCPDHGHRDGLVSVDGYRAFTAGAPQLNSLVTPGDLEALAHLKADLRLIFTAAAAGKGEEVVERLNALLIRYPFHPEIAQHDGQSWHLHLAEHGSAADKYAARAVVGLAGIVTQMGPERLGSCTGAECQGVFIDASTNRSRRFCSDRCAAKVRANVTAFPGRRRSHDAAQRASTAAG
jgi:predicted RNA-binding Zn ribbon-like protein